MTATTQSELSEQESDEQELAEEEVPLEELNRRLAEAIARRAELEKFTDSGMRELQLRWKDKDIKALEQRIQNLSEQQEQA